MILLTGCIYDYNDIDVSVWRTLFAANEFCKLSIRRRLNLQFTLFFLGLILIGCDYQYDALQQPALYHSTSTGVLMYL